ncbi:hypothetical protein M3649_06340 [Ureibacillus chungkukjangi]|uniref:VC0807 family protein n=1 Tax=Ureibacillus chungkukjangi TaxID=1202712 RepID=UPI00203BA4B0|nr:VC0807 family protein [Ureibacillus chungkukjangi]MCM3387750.1 hypothetical protein [Ureibacillus chungkukjangi]
MKKSGLLDLIFYIAIPYFIWKYAREPLGDYHAMLLSTAPGVIYAAYRFLKEKQFNITGLFILGSLCITTTVNLLSQNGENMLWNQVYIGYFFAAIFVLSIIIKKPLALYFALDIAVVQGKDRVKTKRLYTKRGIFKWFQRFTLIFVVRSLFHSTFKAWLITIYGVEGYGKMLVYLNVTDWIFTVLIVLGMIFVRKRISQTLKKE